jgi:hypothetical protein
MCQDSFLRTARPLFQSGFFISHRLHLELAQGESMQLDG